MIDKVSWFKQRADLVHMIVCRSLVKLQQSYLHGRVTYCMQSLPTITGVTEDEDPMPGSTIATVSPPTTNVVSSG